MQSVNDQGSYKINQADRWEPLKSPIIEPEVLLEKALTITTASKAAGIKPLHSQ